MARLVLFSILSTFTCLVYAQSNSDTLRKHVVRLSSMTYPRNARHIESLNKGADYIHSYFSKFSARVNFQSFTVHDTDFKNVIASFGPEDGSRMIVGASYDVYGEIQGADANASGISGLIELARLLKKDEKKLRYRIDLVAYCLGENPTIKAEEMGSYFHAQHLRQENKKVLGMVSLDCIGYFTDQPGSQRYPISLYSLIHGRRGNFIGIFQQPGDGLWPRQMRYLLKQYVRNLRVINFKPAVPFEGYSSSDQRNYWLKGYPALSLSDTKFYRNKNYHYDIDTYETLDYFRMASVVDMLYKSLIHYKS